MLQTRRAGSRKRVLASRAGLAISATAVAVVNYLLADPRQGPRIFADEIGYLANARYLVGGHVIDMSHTAFYAGGFSVAIAPLSWLFRHNPAHLYESVIAMQAVLAGISVVIIAQLCRWLFHARSSVAIVARPFAGLYPAFVFNTGFTWSESMLTFALLLAIGSAATVFQSLDRDPHRGRVVVDARRDHGRALRLRPDRAQPHAARDARTRRDRGRRARAPARVAGRGRGGGGVRPPRRGGSRCSTST